jgi:hypothetical protein
VTNRNGQLTREQREQVHPIDMVAGQTYIIDMESNFDTYLRLHDPQGKLLAQDDDSGKGRNARLVFTPPRTGSYQLIATINGETLNSAEAFRKILRKHYAWEEPMTFRVLRDGKSIEIQIPRPQ